MFKKIKGLIFLSISLLFIIFTNYIVMQADAIPYPELWNVPLHNEYFVKREEWIKKIEHSFKRENILALVGMTGMGKTQLAKEYAYLSYKKYEIIWWFDASNDLESQFKEFSLVWNSKSPRNPIPIEQLSGKALVSYMKDKLRTTPKRWLLIFDNALHKGDIKEYLPESHGKPSAHILITSQDSMTWGNILSIKELKRFESIELVKKIIGKRAEEESVNALAKLLGDFPVALSQAAAYLKACPSLTIGSYIKLFRTAYKQISQDESKLVAQYGESLMEYQYTSSTALKLAIAKILKESQEAYHLLLFISLLDPNQIPCSLLRKFLVVSHGSTFADQTISVLEKHLLLNRDDTQESKSSSYGVHEMLQLVTRDSLEKKQKKSLFINASKAFLSLLDNRLPWNTNISWDEFSQHVKRFLDLIEQEESNESELLKLRVLFLNYLLGDKRDLKEGKKQLDIVEQLLKKIPFNDPFYQALYRINKGNFLVWTSGSYPLALKHQQKALELLQGREREGDQQLRVLAQLAQYSLLQGETESARAYLEQGKDLEQQAKDLPMRGLYHYGKALYFLFIGYYEKGLEHTEVAFNLMREGPPCPSLTFSLESLRAELLLKQGNLKEAYKQSKKSLKKTEFYFQDKTNVFCVKAMIVMAASLPRSEKESHKALALLKTALSIFEDPSKNTTGKHRQHGLVHVFLGDRHTLKQEWKTAYKNYKRAEDIYHTIYKNKKVDDFSELYTKLALFGIKIKDDEIVHTYLKNHIIIFGLNHPRTKEVMKSLDAKKPSTFID